MIAISAKVRALFLIATMMVALTLLAVSFVSLELKPGRSIRFVQSSSNETVETEASEQLEESPVPQLVSPQAVTLLIKVLVYVVIPIALFFTIFTGDGRAWLKRELINGLIAVAFYYLIVRFLLGLDLAQSGSTVQGMVIELSSERMPPIFIAAISFGISSAILAIIGLLYLRWRMRREPTAITVSASAQEAISEIQAGGDLRNVILRCYHEMLESVRQLAGLERLEHVTPREFETHLIQCGLPASDVQQLTRLFEQARYGTGESESERQRALSCLGRIVQTIGVQA